MMQRDTAMPVERLAPFELQAADTDNDGLTLEGYAAVFGSATVIEDHLGRYVEQIAPGAFRKTLSERSPVLQFDHGKHPLIGSIPLGAIQALREDSHGLHVRARLSDNWLIEPVRDAIHDRAINGMSFRFRTIKDEWDESSAMPSRTIREVALFELPGPVVFSAYDSTSVGVRSVFDNDLPDLIERQLSDRFDHDTAAAAAAKALRKVQPSTPTTEPAPATRGMTCAARTRTLTLLNLKETQ